MNARTVPDVIGTVFCCESDFPAIHREAEMPQYCFNNAVNLPFGDTIVRVTEGLKKEMFGILTESDLQLCFHKRNKNGLGLVSI